MHWALQTMPNKSRKWEAGLKPGAYIEVCLRFLGRGYITSWRCVVRLRRGSGWVVPNIWGKLVFESGVHGVAEYF
jgi:hypothetical protein